MNCKKILALLLTLVMLVTVLPMGALTVSAESTPEFLGGDGTEESPYLISNKTHLNNVRKYPSSHFKMVADIVFTEADFAEKGDYYNNGQGWQPIGTDDVTPFIGVFDGNGHIIKGLYVNIQKTNKYKYIYAGLFGYNEGTIKNLGMLDGSVSASSDSSSYAGGIAGYNFYGTISNCYNMGNVSASSDSYSDSYSSSSAGGIAGENDGTISNCYNTGSASALVSSSSSSFSSSSSAGGIAGENDGTISNCYNTGSVSATATSTSSSSYAGGIAGDNSYGRSIRDCYNTGSVSSSSDTSSYAGGIAGDNGKTISNCYNTGSVSATSDSYSYAGGIAGYNGGTISNCYNTGSVSSTASSSDSYAGGIAGRNNGTISNCYNTGSASASVSVSASSSDSYAGGIAGWNNGTISNCYNTGSVSSSSSYSYAGGIAGLNFNGGTIRNCYNAGSVSASSSFSYHSNAGGIAGWNDGTIRDCYNIGSISSSSYAGGIAGDNGGTISNCYNTGSVSSTASSSDSYAEGIAGYNSKGGTISNCYYLNINAKGSGVSCTLKQMTQQNTFVGFDFDTVWTMAGNEDYLYPELQDVPMQFEKELVSISITPPTKTEYLEGKEQLDVTGGKLTLTYNNETTEVIDLAADMVSGFDNTKIGKQTLTVTYQGKTTTFEVEIIAKSLEGIAVTAPPTKTKYLEGKEQLDVTGGKLTLTYNNETTEVIDLAADMVSGFDNTKIGKQTLTVTYQGKTTTFEVEIIAVTVPFRDVDKDAYYAAAVDWAVSNEITNGTSASTFSPDDGCTRGQVVTFLWRAAGKPAPASSTNPFTDVKPGAYYYNAVLWAVEKGITNGTSGTTFSPDETCTRAQIVTFLWRYEGQPAPAGTNNPFADVKPSAYFGSAVLWAVETGITNGTSATTFAPEDTCTRAQVVTFLYRDIVKS